MAVGLACSAACQRVFSCYSVGTRHIPSVKIGFLSLLVYWIAHFAANQSLLLVQRAAAADTSTVSETPENAPDSAPFGRALYDDRSEENQDDLNDPETVHKSYQLTAPDASKPLRGHTRRQQDDLTGLEGVQGSNRGNWSSALKGLIPYTSSREGIGHPDTQHIAEGYDVPFSEERGTREDTVPGSSPWGGEEREEVVQPERPLTAAEEGNESWLKPEETVRAERDSSLMREKRSVALEEGEIQESNGTATAASLRLPQRGRTRQMPTSKRAPSARWGKRLQSRDFLLKTLLPIVGVLAVLGGGLYRYRAKGRAQQSSAGNKNTISKATSPEGGHDLE